MTVSKNSWSNTFGNCFWLLAQLQCKTGCKKHTTNLALIALRDLLALLQERYMSKWWPLFQSRSLELHYQNF